MPVELSAPSPPKPPAQDEVFAQSYAVADAIAFDPLRGQEILELTVYKVANVCTSELGSRS